MPQRLDAIWADFYFELEAGFAELRRETGWNAQFQATDGGAQISTNTFDDCWVTRPRRTEVTCRMRWRSGPDGANERTVRFRLEGDGAFPLIRVEGETEVPETTASAARYLLETLRSSPRPDPAG